MLIGFVKRIFLKKNKLLAIFLDPTGHFDMMKVRYTDTYFQKKYRGQTGAYVIDHNLVYYRRKDNYPMSVYHPGNPLPLNLNAHKAADLDAFSFDKILEAHVVQELFTPGTVKMLTILLILLIVILCLQLFGLGIATHLVKLGNDVAPIAGKAAGAA